MKKIGFRKSHHGCGPCKKRRVKCDEVHPICGHCFRRGEQCEYQALAIRRHARSPSGQVQSQPSSLTPGSEVDSLAPTSTSSKQSPGSSGSQFAAAQDTPAAYLSQTSLQDLRLLHVYVSNASLEYFGSEASSHMWHDTVPKIGFEFPFVLHGILAMAALQCAYGETTPPSNSPYHTIGANHYLAALPLFRAAVANIDESNCAAVLAFSMLAPAIAFAMCSAVSVEDIKSQSSHSSPITDVATIISLLKGIDSIVTSFRETIANGPMGSILQYEANPPAKTLTGRDLLAIETLDRILQNHYAGWCTHGGIHVDYQSLFHNIRESFLECGTNPGDRAVRVKWMMRVPQGFVEAVQTNEVLALVMLLPLGVLLHSLRENWWCKNTGRNLIAAVRMELERIILSSDVQSLLQWAQQSVELP